ncbi:MAG: tyrosine-protein kinase family protein [Myxococcales bacterium]|nr:tyrosine-protein kinase family protein [Myxococcales bacterium]
MAEPNEPDQAQGASERRKTGTYLFVKQGRARKASAGLPQRTTRSVPPVPRDSLVGGELEATPMPLRHRRATLTPADLDRHLCFFFAPDGGAAQAYRGAAEALTEARGAGRRILVSSPTRGAGRTLSCLNLASALAERQAVAVVDCDVGGAGVGAAFGAGAAGWPAQLSARATDPRRPLDLLLVADRLAVLPRGEQAPDAGDFARLEPALEALAEAHDLVLLDGPSVLDDDLAPLDGLYDAVLLVVRPEDLARGRLEKAAAALGDRPVVGALVNDAP